LLVQQSRLSFKSLAARVHLAIDLERLMALQLAERR
jgi:hypothetical protein